MRPGQNKRSRGRNGGGGGGGGSGGGGGGNPHHNNNRPRPPHRQQTFDSNGPNVKIRGSAYQVFERYIALAREAQTGGDRIAAENLYQHAEHYFRIMNAQGEGQGGAPPRPMTPADMEMSGGDGENAESEDMPAQAQHQPPSPPAATRRRAVAVLLTCGPGLDLGGSRPLNGPTLRDPSADGPCQACTLQDRWQDGLSRQPAYATSRSRISISTSCGPRTKAMRTPGRIVFGSTVNSAPFAFNSSHTASMLRTRSPRWSSPT